MLSRLLPTLVVGLLLVPASQGQAPEDAKALIAKAIKAHGGEERLAKLNGFRIKLKGTLNIQGNDVEFTSESAVLHKSDQLKNQVQFELMGVKFNILQVADGKSAWLKVLDMVKDLDGDLLKEMKEESYAGRVGLLVPLLKEPGFQLKTLGEFQVNGKPALAVKVSAKDHRDIELYIDKESGLVVKSRRQSLDSGSGQEVARESFFTDFKEKDGYKYPAKIVTLNDGKKFLTAEVTDYQLVDTIDPKEFTKP